MNSYQRYGDTFECRERKTHTYRCDVVIVFAFLDWVTWQAFVSNDSKNSSRARAKIKIKENVVQEIDSQLHSSY